MEPTRSRGNNMSILAAITIIQAVFTFLILRDCRHNILLVIWAVGFLAYDLAKLFKLF